MKTDRELLELAAKAYGNLLYVDGMNSWIHVDQAGNRGAWWSPLTDDGDALRLAVKLRISLIHEQEYMGGPVLETLEAITPPIKNTVDGLRQCETTSLNALTDDEMANARRAIVRAAAAIGEAMQ